MSSGLEKDEEIEALFLALKESAGGYKDSDYVTFDEFCKGIIDLPFMLEKFKQDFQESPNNSKNELEEANEENCAL